MTITGSAKIYSTFTSQQVFNGQVIVKISTDAGITGWGEMLKDDAKACAAGR